MFLLSRRLRKTVRSHLSRRNVFQPDDLVLPLNYEHSIPGYHV